MADIGNKHWMLRTVHGRQKKFKPNDFAKKINEYFEWAIANPKKKAIIINKPWIESKREQFEDKNGKKRWKTTKITHPYFTAYEDIPRPFSLEALCNHLDIHVSTFRDYETQSDFSNITSRTRQIIDNFNLEGATVGTFNANIIARRLGLIDRKDVTTMNEKLPPPVKAEISLSRDEIKGIARELLSEL